MTVLSPSDLISSLFSLQQGAYLPVFGTALMNTFFSSAFITAWNDAQSHAGILPVVDGDPLTGYFGVKSLSLISVQVGTTSDTSQTVNAMISVSVPDASSPIITSLIVFVVVLENGLWKIDDFDQGLSSYDKNGNLYRHTTVRTYFQTVPALAAACIAPTPSIAIPFNTDEASIDGLTERT